MILYRTSFNIRRVNKTPKTLFLDVNTSLFYVTFSFIAFRIFLDTVQSDLHIPQSKRTRQTEIKLSTIYPSVGNKSAGQPT
jgi:hypothetical protein